MVCRKVISVSFVLSFLVLPNNRAARRKNQSAYKHMLNSFLNNQASRAVTLKLEKNKLSF